uniref:TrbH n=1 Tax=Salmonella enterica subsp. enterica serovar Choleraesuis TaxID=119912 RepID=A9QNR9_SALET|nr:TrbH [Salmonella enterica subsp. enterica serovar Choleraesuis]
MAVSAPVLSSQSTHTFKLPGVVRDNNQSPAACVTGNHLIEWPDRASLTGKLCPDLPRMGGGRRVIIQNIKSGNKPLYHSEISFGHLAFFGTVNQLHQGDRADTHSPLVQVKTLPDAGRFVFYRENADVSIQHKLQHQNDSRSCTEGCSRLSIKSALTLFPSNHSSHDSPARRDDPGSPDSDNFHTFYMFRQCHCFWQSDRLTSVTEKYAGFHHVPPYRDMSYVYPLWFL